MVRSSNLNSPHVRACVFREKHAHLVGMELKLKVVFSIDFKLKTSCYAKNDICEQHEEQHLLVLILSLISLI
jgi:hypothetical protein